MSKSVFTNEEIEAIKGELLPKFMELVPEPNFHNHHIVFTKRYGSLVWLPSNGCLPNR